MVREELDVSGDKSWISSVYLYLPSKHLKASHYKIWLYFMKNWYNEILGYYFFLCGYNWIISWCRHTVMNKNMDIGSNVLIFRFKFFFGRRLCRGFWIARIANSSRLELILLIDIELTESASSKTPANNQGLWTSDSVFSTSSQSCRLNIYKPHNGLSDSRGCTLEFTQVSGGGNRWILSRHRLP